MIIAHYAPGDRPLCGSDCPDQAFTDDPQGVSGCEPCLELVAEDWRTSTSTWDAAFTAGGR